MRDDVVAGLLLDRLDRALERRVVERLDLAAVVADEVMVVVVPGAHRLVARDAVAEVDALQQALLDEAVDARGRRSRARRVEPRAASASWISCAPRQHCCSSRYSITADPRRAHALARALQARVRLVVQLDMTR